MPDRPLGAEPEGGDYQRPWIVAQAPVQLAAGNGAFSTGLTVIFQEDYEAVITPVRDLGDQIMREALVALVVFLLVVVGLWAFVTRMLGESNSGLQNGAPGRTTATNAKYDLTTIAAGDLAGSGPPQTEDEHTA